MKAGCSVAHTAVQMCVTASIDALTVDVVDVKLPLVIHSSFTDNLRPRWRKKISIQFYMHSAICLLLSTTRHTGPVTKAGKTQKYTLCLVH